MPSDSINSTSVEFVPAAGEEEIADDDKKSGPPEEPAELKADLEVQVVVNGATKIEVVHAVWNKRLQWAVFIGIALSAYIYSLDGVTTWQYLSYATSTVLKQSLAGTILTAQAIIIAIGKPLMAKLADVYGASVEIDLTIRMGRAETMLAVAVLYVVGYVLIATAHSIGQIAVGEIFYAFGYTGLQMLQQIIIADLTSLRWRGLATSLLTGPFVINNFVAAAIAQGVLPNWRLGYGMFAILVPVCLAPIICVLFYAQHKAKRSNRIAVTPGLSFASLKGSLIDMDFVGLLLLGTSMALILLPLGLAPEARKGWKTPSMPAMVGVGAVLFPIFLFYEWNVPRRPLLPIIWLSRREIVGACFIGFFDFMSFYLQYTYLYSYIFVTEKWSFLDISYFTATQSLALTAFGILGGIIMWATMRLKYLLLIGLCFRILGVGLMIHARGPHGTTAELVLCQLFQGIGGGFAAMCIQVAAQAAVSHADVATVTAILLLLTELGNSVGSAISSAVWTATMPGEIARHVPSTNATLLAELYQDMDAVVLYPLGSPIRDGVIASYQAVMLRLCLAAVIISILPIVACIFLIKNIRLTRSQNAVDGRELDGTVVEKPQNPGERV